ncbi:TRAP transporter large permease [Chloroflexota bacterium]
MLELIILFVAFMVLLFLGVPVAFALGVPAIGMMLFGFDVPLPIIASRIIDGVDAWTWLAVPLFMMAGTAMNMSGVTERLVNFSQDLIGHISGGLSHVAVLTNTLMAGMSGSIIADAAAVGIFMLPSMKKKGFPPGYSAAVVSTSAIIGPLIPPSITMIVIATVTEASILRMFLGGVFPGIMVAAFLLTSGYFVSKRRGYSTTAKRAPFKQVRGSFFKAIPALLVPVVIIGGMRIGIFTPTEGAAVCAAYIIFIGLYLYRGLTWKRLGNVFFDSVREAGAIMWVVANGIMFSVAIGLTQTSGSVIDFVVSFAPNPQIFMALTVAFLIFLGCFLDLMVMILVFAPLLSMVAMTYGIDPILFNVVFCYAALVGQFTPPNGVTMYMLCGMAECTVMDYIKDGWQFVVALIAGAFLLAYCPPIVTWLPNLVMG